MNDLLRRLYFTCSNHVSMEVAFWVESGEKKKPNSCVPPLESGFISKIENIRGTVILDLVLQTYYLTQGKSSNYEK